MNCGRTRAAGLLNRFDKQVGADGSPFGFDRTHIEPQNIAMARRKIKHFARSNQHTERSGTFNHLSGVTVARQMNP